MNRFKTLLTMAAMIVAVAGFGSASAQDTTTAYVVHGIPGDDFGLDPLLPVDVMVSGLGCALPGFEFGDRVGPLEVPAGSYDITISLADEAMPCGGDAVIVLEGVALAAGANVTLIAHRTADGTAGPGDQLGLGITASAFANDFSATGRGRTRIIAHHTALAPAVDVVISRDYSDPGAPGVTVPAFSNPTSPGEALLSQINAEFRPGGWDVTLEVGGAPVFGPASLDLSPYTSYYVYAVGDFFGGTFQYLIFSENGLKERKRRDPAERGTPRGRRVR